MKRKNRTDGSGPPFNNNEPAAGTGQRREIRDHVIRKDEITDLVIALNVSRSADEFLALLLKT